MVRIMYNELFNRKAKKTFRQQLRNEPTFGEKALWFYLQGRKVDGFKFRRQQGVGQFVVDFYCPSAKLIIEVDGETHQRPESIAHDIQREKYLTGKGLRVLRFTDDQVLLAPMKVIEKIKDNLKVKDDEDANPSQPPLKKGRRISKKSSIEK